MKIERIENMKGGWFIGNFEPSVYKTEQFEVCFKQHKKDEYWTPHFHKQAIEINYLIRGVMTINGQRLVSGDIFILDKEEISIPIFLTDCELIVVKTPCVIGDKFELDPHIMHHYV